MLRLRLPLTLVALLFAIVLPAVAHADDWVVTKLRGAVLQLVDGDWAPLSRGDVVSDDRVLRSLRSGRAELQRGVEVISIGPETQIQIHDKTGKQFTTVQQYFGKVEIDAEARNVKHFAVQTPYLAAVVKGTHFVVATGKKGSEVAVERGHVAVADRHSGLNTLLAKGQQASVDADGRFEVDGSGVLPPVLDKKGKVVSTGAVVVVVPDTAKAATVTRDSEGNVVVVVPTVVTGTVGVTNGVTVGTKGGGDEGVHLGVVIGSSHHSDDHEKDDDKGDRHGVDVKVGGDTGLHLGVGHSESDSGHGIRIGVSGRDR